MFVKVRVRTGQRKESIEHRDVGRFEISVKEKPKGNAANRRVVELLAGVFGVSLRHIRFISGRRSPAKLFEIREN